MNACDNETGLVLLEIAQRYGTPTYAYNIGRIRTQTLKLKETLPDGIDLFYSLKANASLGLSGFIARCDLGADVASAGELVTAVEAGFPSGRIFVSGPDKSPEMLSYLLSMPEAIISVDSPSELEILAREGVPNRVVLRLRPDYDSFAVVTAASDSRFGIPCEELARCCEYIGSQQVKVIGFHVFSGSQVLDAEGIIHHLRRAMKLSRRAADVLGIRTDFINLGGGFGIPYAIDEPELNLVPIATELMSLQENYPTTQLAIELGRYIVAQSGWYLTRVIAHQTHHGRKAVVVDGGTHQRADVCGLGLRNRSRPPAVLNGKNDPIAPTDVLGRLSLPADVLAEKAELPPLEAGDVLAFPNAGAYGLWASPLLFHAHLPPVEVVFEGTQIECLRHRQSARDILTNQVLYGQGRKSEMR